MEKTRIIIEITSNLKGKYKPLEANVNDEIFNYLETYLMQDNEDFETELIGEIAECDGGDVMYSKEGSLPANLGDMGKVSITMKQEMVDSA